MSDLELIREIEPRIGKTLEAIEFDSILRLENGYVLNQDQYLIGLNLDDCELDDIAFLSQFSLLQRLSLCGNRITKLAPLKELKNLIYLQLNDNQITALGALIELKNLSCLDLDNNLITELTALKGLKNLSHLSLCGNPITELAALKELKNLSRLDLIGNEITELDALNELKSLCYLDLRGNKIRTFSAWILDLNLEIKWGWDSDEGIYLQDNPLESPPPKIIKQGNAAIKAYFDSLKDQQRPLNELKVLLVGDGGAGKTSLSKVLRDEDFNPKESQTHGINIDHWQHQDLTLHFWDFGGQKTMHATHQFFLSERSLYILVLDGRKEEDAEYWLKHIESFGGDSPVLIVLNKMDENPAFDVNRKHLLDKYKGIVGFYKLSCDTGQGLAEFKQALIKAFTKVHMLQTQWGESWFQVKQALENWTQNYITSEQYRELCYEQHINDSQTQNILAKYLNDLGVVVYFPDLELNDTHVLEPRWITEAVYKIINSKQLAAKQGVLCLKDLAEILMQKSKEDFHYPPEKHRHIIELMKKFELCYQVDRDHILIPDLLDVQEPDFSLNDKQPLRFRLQYDFLPKSVMPRFIVKRHQEIKDDLRWRTGVVLYDKNNQATAIIRADNRERLIDIQVSGKQKRDYFAVIRGTLNEIHNDFKKLPTELVPLPDNPAYTVEYQELIGYELDGEDNYRVGKLRKIYSVSELLNGIARPEQRQGKIINNYGHLKMTERKIEAKNYVERDNTGDMAGCDFNKHHYQNQVKTEHAENSSSYHVQTWEKVIGYLAGFLIVCTIVFLAVRNEAVADKNLAVMLRTLLSLAIAVLGAVVPGMLKVGWKGQGFWIRAGGALALFVLAFFGTPTVF